MMDSDGDGEITSSDIFTLFRQARSRLMEKAEDKEFLLILSRLSLRFPMSKEEFLRKKEYRHLAQPVIPNLNLDF